MSKKTKALVFNFIGFAVFFLGFYYIVKEYTNLTGYWIPITAFVVSTILAPKFQVIRTRDGEKLFAKWMFFKGIKEIK